MALSKPIFKESVGDEMVFPEEALTIWDLWFHIDKTVESSQGET